MTGINPQAGEAELNLGGEQLVLKLTLGGLAAWQAETGAAGFMDLFNKVTAADVPVLMAGVRHLTTDGDAAAALAAVEGQNAVEAVGAMVTTLVAVISGPADDGDGGSAGNGKSAVASG